MIILYHQTDSLLQSLSYYNFSYQNDITGPWWYSSFWFIQYYIVFNVEISLLPPWVIMVEKSVIIKICDDNQ